MGDYPINPLPGLFASIAVLIVLIILFAVIYSWH
jgi:hypothetical protein